MYQPINNKEIDENELSFHTTVAQKGMELLSKSKLLSIAHNGYKEIHFEQDIRLFNKIQGLCTANTPDSESISWEYSWFRFNVAMVLATLHFNTKLS